MIGKVLLVDDDAAVREALAQTLELADITPITAGSFVAAKDRMGFTCWTMLRLRIRICPWFC